MAKVWFREPVEYMGRKEYMIDHPLIMTGPAGIEFRPSLLVNEDGSFDLTLVPWDNIVSYTSAIMPDEEDDPNALSYHPKTPEDESDD